MNDIQFLSYLGYNVLGPNILCVKKQIIIVL